VRTQRRGQRRAAAPGQDTSAVEAYKVWERDDDGLTAQFPAVREIEFESHLGDLSKLVEMFMTFADMETFIGPATGGDMDKMPSEPMRTAAGASMMKGDAALPFKDIIRNFDFFTQSVILSLVYFNRKFNPQIVKEGDYDVIARGATSLIAKEVRGIQTDVLAQTLTPEDRDWIDEESFIRQRMATRDMTSLMLPKEEAMRNRSQRMAAQAEMSDLNKQMLMAEIRKELSDAFKSDHAGSEERRGGGRRNNEHSPRHPREGLGATMDLKERRERLNKLISDLASSTSNEVVWMRELFDLQFEDAKERLVDAEGIDVPRIQGEARYLEKFTQAVRSRRSAATESPRSVTMTLKHHFRMTASELAMGRYMRAPDHAAADDEFAQAFATSERMSRCGGSGRQGGREMERELVLLLVTDLLVLLVVAATGLGPLMQEVRLLLRTTRAALRRRRRQGCLRRRR
jgi:hypothetical protein